MADDCVGGWRDRRSSFGSRSGDFLPYGLSNIGRREWVDIVGLTNYADSTSDAGHGFPEPVTGQRRRAGGSLLPRDGEDFATACGESESTLASLRMSDHGDFWDFLRDAGCLS